MYVTSLVTIPVVISEFVSGHLLPDSDFFLVIQIQLESVLNLFSEISLYSHSCIQVHVDVKRHFIHSCKAVWDRPFKKLIPVMLKMETKRVCTARREFYFG